MTQSANLMVALAHVAHVWLGKLATIEKYSKRLAKQRMRMSNWLNLESPFCQGTPLR